MASIPRIVAISLCSFPLSGGSGGTLGAVSGDIFQMVLKDGLRATFLGIACGIIAGLGLTRLIASVLYGMKPSDWATFSGVSLVLLIVAVVACAVPARRAMQVDLIVALRYE